MKSINEHDGANEQKWDKRAETFDKKGFSSLYFGFLQKKVVSIARLQKNTNFLDLGCGTGCAVFYAATLLRGQGKFVGIDISEGMIERAKENASGLKNVSFYKASSEELPLENDFFDVIVCTNSFHHYLNPVRALAEAHRVLKQKGRIYILDLTSDDFFIKWFDRRTRKREKEHVKYYSTAEYEGMFSKVGLKYVGSRPIAMGSPLKVHGAEK